MTFVVKMRIVQVAKCYILLPSGKHTKNYGKSPCFMGKFTIFVVIVHSDVKLPEGKLPKVFLLQNGH